MVDGEGNVFLRFPDNNDTIGQPIFAKALDATSQETEKAVESVGPDGMRRLIGLRDIVEFLYNSGWRSNEARQLR